MSSYYGTVAVQSGSKSIIKVANDGISGVLLGNESGLTIVVSFEGLPVSRSLYPGVVDWFPVPTRGFNGNIVLTPTSNLSNVSTWPGSYVQIDAFGVNEAPNGTYPISLSRASNVGNTLITQSGNIVNVTNDGNPSGTVFIEATVGAEVTSSVTLTNDGQLTLGNGSHAANITNTGNITASGTLSTDGAKHTTDGSGNLIFGGKLGIASVGDVLDAVTSSLLTLNSKNGSDIVLKVAAAEVARIKSNGIFSLTNTGQNSYNGPTSGNAKLYFVLIGTVKILVINFNNYQNNTGSAVQMNFPGGTIMNAPSFWITTETPGMTSTLSGSQQTKNIITSLAAAGGGITNQLKHFKNSFAFHQSANCDGMVDSTNDGSAHTGQMIGISF